jgi:hypothetical protein
MIGVKSDEFRVQEYEVIIFFATPPGTGGWQSSRQRTP